MDIKHLIIAGTLIFFCFLNLQAQQINTDSLLVRAYESLQNKNYAQAMQQGYMGKKVSPEYLDFQVLIGRVHQLTKQQDSARYYFKQVIDKNPAYEEAFTYLINLELESGQYQNAEIVINKALDTHPENNVFPLKKWQLYRLQNDVEKEKAYLTELSQRFPENSEIKQRLFWLDSRYNSNRIGLQYSLTHFNREGLGPWHLGTVQYIGERKWGSILGRINYANRQANGSTLIDGIQYEGEAYFFTGKKSYTNISLAYAEDQVFPKWRIGASYFQTLPKGWEVDLGFRYAYVAETNIAAAIAGVGKYFGPYWIHLRSFFQEQDKNWFPAFTLTTRYYFDTRFDYINLILGYGTSADERAVLADLNQRVTLDSYRAGLGYYKQFGKHFLAGIQGVYNRQEYIEDNWQNEWESFFMLHYRF